MRDELFTASRGDGAKMNDRRIRVTKRRELTGALVATGFPFKYPEHTETYLQTFGAVFPKVSDLRRAGSAALDLAYVAAGRLDGYWEIGLQDWDLAAGVLLVEEAGGTVSDFSGGDKLFGKGNVIAGGLAVHAELHKTIAPVLSDELK
jgi:myo-inositol-1(or 4)-monophosphatase